MALSYHPPAPVNRHLRLVQDEEAPPYDGRSPRREPFAMIPHAVLDEYAAKVGPIAWCVFTGLARHADAEGRCWPSRQRLGDLLGIHPNSVSNGIAKLVAAGLVVVEKRTTDTGSQASNGYVIPCLCHHTRCEVPPTKSDPPSHLVGPPLTPDVNELDVVNENQKNENGECPPTPRKSSHVAYPADFEAWWARYPKGRGTKKVAADRWRRLDAADRAAASVGLDAWLASDQWQRDGGKYILWAERFLERRAWENDPPPPVPAAPSPNGNGRRGPDAAYFARMAEDLRREREEREASWN